MPITGQGENQKNQTGQNTKAEACGHFFPDSPFFGHAVPLNSNMPRAGMTRVRDT
jgi:hypothetical protein